MKGLSASSDESGAAYLLRPSPSPTLLRWWVVLHLILGATVSLIGPGLMPGLLLASLVCWHFHGRFPKPAPMLLICPGQGFALPSEGRYRLGLAPRTSIGAGWVWLTFDDRPAAGYLLLRDQFTRTEWRRLTFAVRER